MCETPRPFSMRSWVVLMLEGDAFSSHPSDEKPGFIPPPIEVGESSCYVLKIVIRNTFSFDSVALSEIQVTFPFAVPFCTPIDEI